MERIQNIINIKLLHLIDNVPYFKVKSHNIALILSFRGDQPQSLYGRNSHLFELLFLGRLTLRGNYFKLPDL